MRDSSLPPTDDEPDPERDPDRRMKLMGPGSSSVLAVVGLAGGWLLHPLGERLWGSAPLVGWLQVGVLWFVAAFLGFAARSTRRDLRATPRRLESHQAVNRLVLARACALVGALLAGGYTGYAISWIGDGAELADQRMLRSLIAATAGIVMVGCATALERACRTGSGRPGA